MLKKIFFILFSVSIISLLGCESSEGTEEALEEPFIFSYNHGTIDTENEEEVNRWFNEEVREDKQQIYVNDLGNGYIYFYGKGFNEVYVRYQLELRDEMKDRSIFANFTRGDETDYVFIEVKYNPIYCCDGIAVETNE